MYDPTTGRWTSEDPTGFAGGDANLYRYVGNNPTNATDPSGLYEIPYGSRDGQPTFYPGGPRYGDGSKPEYFGKFRNGDPSKEKNGVLSFSGGIVMDVLGFRQNKYL